MTTYTAEETDGHVEIRNAEGCTVWCGRRARGPAVFRCCVGRSHPGAATSALHALTGSAAVRVLPAAYRNVTLTIRMTVAVPGIATTEAIHDALMHDGVELPDDASIAVDRVDVVEPMSLDETPF